MRGSGRLSRRPPLSHTGRRPPSKPQLTSIRARGRLSCAPLGMGGGAARVSGRCGRRRPEPQVLLHVRPQTDRACGALRGSDARVAPRPVRAPPRRRRLCVRRRSGDHGVAPATAQAGGEVRGGGRVGAGRSSRCLVPRVARCMCRRRPAACVACRQAAPRAPRPGPCGRRRGAAACVCAAAAVTTAWRPPACGQEGRCGGAGESARGAAAAVWCCRCGRACGRQRRACAACRVAALRVPRLLQCGRRRGTAACVCAAAAAITAAITARQPPSHVHGGGGGGAGESARGAAAAV